MSMYKLTLLEDKSLCIVHKSGTLDKPQLYLQVWNAAHGSICESCDLRAQCDEIFGARGAECPAYPEGNRWQEIEPTQQESLKKLLTEQE